MEEKCTIVVAVCENLNYTRLFLESLFRGTNYPFELVIVDNGSTDGTPEYLASLGGCKVIRNEENLGVAKAWNQGIAAATGHHICLCNNDIVVPRGWLRPLVQELDNHDELGLVSATEEITVLHFSDVFREEAEFLSRVGYDLELDFEALDAAYGGFDRFAAEFMEKYRDTRLPEVGNASCMLIRRELIEDIGVFDETIGIAYYEDCDYLLRTFTNARFNMFEAYGGSYFHHFHGKSAALVPPDTMSRSREAFYRKWPHAQPIMERWGFRGGDAAGDAANR